MNTHIETHSTSNKWRIIGWGGAGALLLTPLIAMQFTPEVNWTAGDFLFAAIMFGTVGVLLELLMRKSGNSWYRAGCALAVLSGFVVIWVNLAVGMINNEDAPANLYLILLVPIALIGSAIARFRASLMAWIMAGVGTVQAALAILAGIFGPDPRGGTLTLVLSGLWFVSALLLRQGSKA